MGLLRGAVRAGTRATRTATRTTYRTGKSVARGRVPNIGVGAGVAGFGVRVGTRGVSLRTPIARQSIGASGFRTTVGLPGVAHVTVNPLRPSATAGVGPLRLTAAKNPGVGLTSRFVSVGVTTKPLLWMRLGAFRVALPGAVPSFGKPWSEEVDEQWMPYYHRRPPDVSAQIHQLINQMERAETQKASVVCPQIHAPNVLPAQIDESQRALELQKFRNNNLAGISIFARKRRKEARARADEQLREWISSERDRLDEEHDELTDLIRSGWESWKSGNPIAEAAVVNSAFGALGSNAVVVEIGEESATLVVFALRFEDVHPSKPAFTPNGNPTIKKRTTTERREVHRELVGSTVCGSLRIAMAYLQMPLHFRVAVVIPAPNDSIGNQPVVAWFEFNRGADLPTGRGEVGVWISRMWLKTPKSLAKILPDETSGAANAPALGIGSPTTDQMSSAEFWVAIATAVNGLSASTIWESRETVLGSQQQDSVLADSKRKSKTKQSPSTQGDNIVYSEVLDNWWRTIDELNTAEEMVAGQEQLDNAFNALADRRAASVSDPIAGGLLLSLAYCAAELHDATRLSELADISNSLNLTRKTKSELRSYVRSERIEAEENVLIEMLERARAAIDDSDADAVIAVFTHLVERLPSVPEGADDEAEDVGWALIESVAALGCVDQLVQLGNAINESNSSVVRRLQPVYESGQQTIEAARAYLNLIEQQPGFIQSKIGEATGFSQELMRKVGWQLDHFGRIRRLKKGSSYQVFLDEEVE